MKTILQYLINGSFFLALAAVICAGLIFLAREWYMWRGIQSVRSDLMQMNGRAGGSECQALVGDEEFDTGIETQSYVQLRFESDRSYVIETVCAGFSRRPVSAEQRVLPAFVSKVQGSSGVVRREEIDKSLIGLTVFANLATHVPPELQPWLGWISRTEVIGIEGGTVVHRPLASDETMTAEELFGTGPMTSCEGYGFACCAAETQLGSGDSVANVSSCPGNCFSSCRTRPVIASWKTNPLADWETGELRIQNGSSVQFFYVLQDDSANGPWKATINFGDGQKEIIQGTKVPQGEVPPEELAALPKSKENAYGNVIHVYTCPAVSCQYTASVIVENAQGTVSADTPNSLIKIAVDSTASVDGMNEAW